MTDNLKYLEALINSDSKVISELYLESLPKIKKFVLQNKGTPQDAEDVFQKALIQIAVRYKKNPFSVTSSFHAFLFTACKNLWRRELNKSSRWVTKDILEEQLYEKNEDALALLEQERWDLFQAALDLSSDSCKSILKLFFKKISYSQMVVDLGYSSETVARQRVFKCKKKLIELVKNSSSFNALKEL